MKLNITTKEDFNLDSSDLVGKRVAVLGISGSGKSNTVAAIVEELLSANFAMTIVDIEGEYWSLKERYQILVAGQSDNVDFQAFTPAQAAALAELSITSRAPVILDLSDFEDDDERTAFLVAYFARLWLLSKDNKLPYEIIIEEAHEFIPQGGRSELKTILTRIALRGRKRGLGMILSSQRSAKIDKDLLTQANILFLHHVAHPVDMTVYKDLIPLPAKEVEAMVGNLQVGQAVAIIEHKPQTLQVRRRHTLDIGATPGLDVSSLAQVKIDASMLAQLEKLSAKTGSDDRAASGELAKLRAQVKTLQQTLEDVARERDDLRREVERLSRLTVHLDASKLPQVAPTAPNTLLIEQAHINKLTTSPDSNGHQTASDILAKIEHAGMVKQKMIKAFSQPEAKPVAAVPAVATVVKKPDNGLTADQRQRFENLITTYNKTFTQFEKDILKLLLEHDGKALTRQQIDSYLGKGVDYFRKHYPSNLERRKLIAEESRRDKTLVYRATVKEYYTSAFIGADVEAMQAELLKRLK